MNIEKEIVFSLFRLIWLFTYHSAQLHMIKVVPEYICDKNNALIFHLV